MIDLNFIKEYLTPERIEQIKGVVATFFAMGGWDVITGAWSNCKIKRASYILKWGKNALCKVARICFGIAEGIEWLENYGNETDKI